MASITQGTIEQINLIGVQSAELTGVDPTTRISTFTIAINRNDDPAQVRGGGYKYPRKSYNRRTWSTVAISDGTLDYNESLLLFAGAFPVQTSVEVAPATEDTPAVYRHTLQSNTFKRDRTNALTVARGTYDRADIATGVVLTELGFTANRENGESSISGSGLGRGATVTTTLGTGPAATELASAPVRAGDLDVIISDTLDGLDTAEPVDYLRTAAFSIGSKRAANWVLKRSIKSFKNTVETAPDFTLTLTCEATEDGEYLTQIAEAGERVYVRLDFQGDELIPGVAGVPADGTTPAVPGTDGVHEGIQVTLPCDVYSVGAKSDSGGVWQLAYTLRPAHDDALGASNEIVFTNTVPTLPTVA